jgi:hypothetical protein
MSMFRTLGKNVIIAGCVHAILGAGCLTVPAYAQNAELIAKLATLTVRKGFKDISLGRACLELGLPQLGANCLVYQSPYQDTQAISHVVNVIKDPNFRSYVILIRGTDSNSKDYLIGPSGNLLAAANFRKGLGRPATWSKISITAPDSQAELAGEISYWRIQQTELANEPDRKD